MNKKNKPYYIQKTLEVPLYSGTLVLIDSDSVEEIIRKNKFSQDAIDFLEEKPLYAHTLYAEKYKGDRAYYIIFNSKSNHKITSGVIAHESSHATSCVMHDIGWKHDYCNEEPYSYLLGWIMDSCYSFMKGKVKIK